jgi:hypothetical protein
MQIDTANLLTLAYVALFPSTLAYLCFNRGVQLIGANRPRRSSTSCRCSAPSCRSPSSASIHRRSTSSAFALVLTGVFVAPRKPATS